MLQEELERAREMQDPIVFIWGYAGLGDFESALDWAEKTLDARSGMLPVMIKYDPRLDPLRGNLVGACRVRASTPSSGNALLGSPNDTRGQGAHCRPAPGQPGGACVRVP